MSDHKSHTALVQANHLHAHKVRALLQRQWPAVVDKRKERLTQRTTGQVAPQPWPCTDTAMSTPVELWALKPRSSKTSCRGCASKMRMTLTSHETHKGRTSTHHCCKLAQGAQQGNMQTQVPRALRSHCASSFAPTNHIFGFLESSLHRELR